ncbi:MAG: 23S rRNA (guanosine(2251)-2'-O)-methyltransferase RlmB [Myxococcales bacterium]
MSRIVFGIHPVKELLERRPEEVEKLHVATGAGRAVADVIDRARAAGVRGRPTPRGELDRLAAGGNHQGVVAEVAEFRYADLEDLLQPGEGPMLLVLLDGIEDPQNFGAIVRSAHALGATGVVIPQDRAAGVSAAAVKASAGAVEKSRIARVVNLSRAIERIQESGTWVAALEAQGEKPLWEADLTGPLALVVGSEGKGIRPLVRRHCDLSVGIPMAGTLGSLNAAAAAAVALYEIVRQRRGGAGGVGVADPPLQRP